MHRIVLALVCLNVFAFTPPRTGAAADKWSEIKSAHFTIWSNASDREARSVAWQLEQIRSALSVLYPWAKVDLSKPLLVFAVKDENSIKALAPEFWERKGGVRPTSVWAGGPDQSYILIRTDVRGDDRATVNPYSTSYFSYVNLILQSSFERPLPLWFSRGLSGVLSNTIVGDDFILLGPTIPWHLEQLRDSGRLPLLKLVSVTRDSAEYRSGSGLQRFDAQAWALMHYLMFADGGAHAAKVNRFATLVNTGGDQAGAFAEAFGRPEQYEAPFATYINRNLFTYRKAKADAAVRKERFVSRPIAIADAAAGRALLHVAMRRPAEAAALIAEARKADPNVAAAHVAEAVQLDMSGKTSEAKVAYTRAVELGSSNPYAYYRSAVLNWPNPDEPTLQRMEKSLVRAIELHPTFALAHSSLAEVKMALAQPAGTIVPLVVRAMALEPSNPWHRMAAARVSRKFGNREEALKLAHSALALADNENERREAERLIAFLAK